MHGNDLRAQSDSETWRVPFDSVVFADVGQRRPRKAVPRTRGRDRGRGDTARLMSNAERSLADEAGGPVAQLLPIPQDGGDGVEDTDPLAGLKSDIAKAKGNALLVETTAGGWQEGAVRMRRAPTGSKRDSGRCLPEAMVQARGTIRLQRAPWRRRAFRRGCSPRARTEPRCARACASGISASCARWREDSWSRNCRRNSAWPSRSNSTTIRWTWFPGRKCSRSSPAVEGVSPEMALALAQIGDGDA